MRENQKLTQLWIKITLGVPIIGLAALLIMLELNIGKIQLSDSDFTGLIIGFLILMLIAFLIFKIELQTEINNEGIRVRLIPFHRKFREFNWAEIEKVSIRDYKPIAEYGGWGLRYSISGKGKAYNVSGNRGIQIQFKTGKKLLIGTNKPEKAEAVLRKLNIIGPGFSEN